MIFVPPRNVLHSDRRSAGEGLDSSQRSHSIGARSSAIRLGIMPFKTVGSTKEHGLSLGLAEEFAGAFSRFRWITCVAPASIASVANEPLGPMSRWQQLDLDFWLKALFTRKAKRFGCWRDC